MKKRIAACIVSTSLAFVGGMAIAEKVHDWHDLEAVHDHVKEAIHETEVARAAKRLKRRKQRSRAEFSGLTNGEPCCGSPFLLDSQL